MPQVNDENNRAYTHRCSVPSTGYPFPFLKPQVPRQALLLPPAPGRPYLHLGVHYPGPGSPWEREAAQERTGRVAQVAVAAVRDISCKDTRTDPNLVPAEADASQASHRNTHHQAPGRQAGQCAPVPLWKWESRKAQHLSQSPS